MDAQFRQGFARRELEIANRVIAFSRRGIIRGNDFCRSEKEKTKRDF